MNTLLALIAVLLLLALVGGLWRVVVGPTAADRLVAAQLLGTLGIGILLLSAQLTGEPAGRDAALLMAVLSLVATMTFVRRLAPKAPAGGGDA